MSTILERLRDTPCDREPFTPEHAECRCRLAFAAADEIESLEAALKLIASGMRGDKVLAEYDLSAIAYAALDASQTNTK